MKFRFTTKALRHGGEPGVRARLRVFAPLWLNFFLFAPAIAQTFKPEVSLGKIDVATVTFSQDGMHFAKLQVDGPTRMSFLLDGVPNDQYFKIAPTIRFSPDSKRFAYAAAEAADRWHIVIDGEKGLAFDSLDDTSIVFSADNRIVAYIATRQKQAFVIVGAQTFGPFAAASQLALSRDGQRAAFTVQAKRLRPTDVYLNREAVSSWDYVEQLALSDDGMWLAVRGKYQGHISVGVFGAQSQVYDFKAGDIFFLAGSHKLVSTPRRGAGGPLAIEGNMLRNISGGFEGVSLTPDGLTISFTGAGRSEVLKSDGMAVDADRRAFFSPDGTRTIYAMPDPIDRMISIELGEKSVHCMSYTPPIFSATNKIAFAAINKDNQQIVYVEEVAATKCDQVRAASLAFSPDGNHIAFAGKMGSKWVAVVDDTPGTIQYDDILDRPFMVDALGRFHFIGIRNGEAFLCTTAATR